jgi:hypothetical protein
MPPGGDAAWISAYIAQGSKRAGVYLTFSKAFEQGPEIYEELMLDRDTFAKEVGAPLTWERVDSKVYVSVPRIPFADLDSPSDRERVIVYLAEMTRRMIRVFRPRLEALTYARRAKAAQAKPISSI